MYLDVSLQCTCSRHAGEEARWTEQSKEFDTQIQQLTGDCAVASAFVSYLGPFNKEFRELLITRDFYGDCIRLKVPVTPNMNVSKFLVDDAEVGEWTLQVCVRMLPSRFT
jgi:dynein heavy chain